MPPGSLGRGTALIQEGRALAYAIRALSEPKKRYGTIKKEIVAIVFAFER